MNYVNFDSYWRFNNCFKRALSEGAESTCRTLSEPARKSGTNIRHRGCNHTLLIPPRPTLVVVGASVHGANAPFVPADSDSKPGKGSVLESRIEHTSPEVHYKPIRRSGYRHRWETRQPSSCFGRNGADYPGKKCCDPLETLHGLLTPAISRNQQDPHLLFRHFCVVPEHGTCKNT